MTPRRQGRRSSACPLGREAHRLRVFNPAAGDLLAVDQYLGIAATEAAQLHAVVFHDVGTDEADARHALQHVADGTRLEALEILQVVHQGRRDFTAAVAVSDLALDDDGVQPLDPVFRSLFSSLVRSRRGGRPDGGILRPCRGSESDCGDGMHQGDAEQVLLHVLRGPVKGITQI